MLSGSEAGVTFSHDADGSKVQYMVVPGVFRFFTQFTNQPEAPEHVLAPLRTWSAPLLPRVNQGALFGLGGGTPLITTLFFNDKGTDKEVAVAVLPGGSGGAPSGPS